MLTAVLICWLILGVGCGSGRTVLVSEDSPIRTGPDVAGRVYQMVDGEWQLSGNRVAIPEGWYIVPPRFVDDDDQ